MRLPEAKIKEAILHPDVAIRDRATHYFGESSVPDRSIMPVIIKAVETYGKHDAYKLIGASRDLAQTEESIAWVIEQLNDEQCDQYENYAYNLSMVLTNADPAILLPHESAILEARHFLPELETVFTERLLMLSWDQVACWRKLEEFCEAGKDKQYVNEIDLGHGERIVEALARYGTDCEDRVHELLSLKIEDFRHDPMKWMEPLVVRLAGQAHLVSKIPLIVSKLLEDDGDLLNEACAEALTTIGTPAVLEAVADAFPKAESSFRRYAIEPLEKIHSDLAVETCIRLLAHEMDDRHHLDLAQALLSQFAPEGIESARRLLLGRPLDFEGQGLRNYLLETCTIMGESFPEYEEWKAAEKADKEEHWKRIDEIGDDPQGLLFYALEKLTGKKTATQPKAKPAIAPMPRPILLSKPERKQKVGRNDPCPCQSGKKLKNCCIKKQGGA
jgi:SEC-C motif